MRHGQSPILSFYAKIPELVLVLLPLDAHVADVSAGRPVVAPLDEVADIFSEPLRNDLHGTVLAVPHASFDSKASGLFQGRGAEEDPLDAALDD
jgi:hypothetical protein